AVSCARRGHYRAAERLIAVVFELVLCLRGEIEAAILLGEAFRFEDTLLPNPANATHAQRDNVNGQPCGLALSCWPRSQSEPPHVSSPSVTTTMRPGLLR